MPAFYKEWFYRAKLSLMATVITKPQPRPIVFVGENSSLKLCDTISRFGLKKILVVTDKPLVELGMLEGTQAALRERGVECQLYDGVLPDPTQQVVDDGIAMLRQHQCDGVLAFGGGSSIDAAKVIALATTAKPPIALAPTRASTRPCPFLRYLPPRARVRRAPLLRWFPIM